MKIVFFRDKHLSEFRHCFLELYYLHIWVNGDQIVNEVS